MKKKGLWFEEKTHLKKKKNRSLSGFAELSRLRINLVGQPGLTVCLLLLVSYLI